jgi:hypothetical protein
MTSADVPALSRARFTLLQSAEQMFRIEDGSETSVNVDRAGGGSHSLLFQPSLLLRQLTLQLESRPLV